MEKSIKSKKIKIKRLALIIWSSNNFITLMVGAEMIQYFFSLGISQCPTLKFLTGFLLLLLLWVLLRFIEVKATNSWPSFEPVKE